jgi:uncharacterized protein
MNNVMYFEVQADHPDRTIAFYTDIFGWKFSKQEGLPVEYWRIETEGIAGGLLKRPFAPPPTGIGTNAYVCSMEVTSFDETAKKILEHGGEVALEKFPVPGRCWQGYFLDTEGNTFGIFEVDENAA